MTVENKIREPATPEQIMDILHNPINNRHPGTTVITQFSTSISTNDFMSLLVLRYCWNFYQWFRDILDCAAVNTKLLENHQKNGCDKFFKRTIIVDMMAI